MTVLPTMQSRGLAPSARVLANGVIVLVEVDVGDAGRHAQRVRPGWHGLRSAGPSAASSHFVSRTIDRGTATRSADEIAEELDGRGVSLAVTVNRHVLSLICTCLVEDFEPVLALLADIIRHPTFPSGEVETRRGEIVTLIRQDEDNPAVVAVEGLMAMLYGAAHPYGRPLRGTIGTVERIDSAVLSDFHARAVHAVAALSLVVGRRRRAGARGRRGVSRVRRRGRAPAAARRSSCPRRCPRAAARRDPRDSDDEQGAGRHRLRVHVDRARRPAPTTPTG